MSKLSFEYDEEQRQLLVHYDLNGERVLLGAIPPGEAQHSPKLFTWANERLALLGLEPIKYVVHAQTGIAINRPDSPGKLFGG